MRKQLRRLCLYQVSFLKAVWRMLLENRFDLFEYYWTFGFMSTLLGFPWIGSSEPAILWCWYVCYLCWVILMFRIKSQKCVSNRPLTNVLQLCKYGQVVLLEGSAWRACECKAAKSRFERRDSLHPTLEGNLFSTFSIEEASARTMDYRCYYPKYSQCLPVLNSTDGSLLVIHVCITRNLCLLTLQNTIHAPYIWLQGGIPSHLLSMPFPSSSDLFLYSHSRACSTRKQSTSLSTP